MTFALSYLNDRLKIQSVAWDVKRTDELSGTADGRIWQAELAPPLWTAEITLRTDTPSELKQVAALIRRLRGSQESFMLNDPTSKFPQADPTGSKLGSSTPTVSAINATNRSIIKFAGLPNGYVLTLGDKFEINYGASPIRYGFFEVSETVAAASTGITPDFNIFPELPSGVPTNASVKLIRPACRCIIIPGSNQVGKTSLEKTEGATFKVIQKK